MRKPSAIFVAGALILASCSSGSTDSEITVGTLFPPTTTSVATTTTGVVATTTIPVATTTVVKEVPEVTVLEAVPLADYAIPEYTTENDTFSFENFGGGEAPADLTVNMARRLYGDNQVCSDVTNNQCTPYPVILQLMSQANKSMRGGLCEGLAVLSMRLSGDIETLASFQNTETVAELIREDPALLSEIAYWYVTQFAMEVQQEASSYLELSPTELAEILLYDFAEAERGNPYTGFTIGIYSDQGGHAITPYRVEEMPRGYRIYIYDSNWPNEERWIDVSKDGTWMYALAATNPTEQSEAWSGGTGTMELTPMRARTGPFTCSFCPQEDGEESGTMLTVAASGSKQMALKIKTESGQRLGYYNGKFVNEIPGATYRYLISGPSTSDPVLVFLPPGVESFSADVEEIAVPEQIEDVVEETTEQRFSLLVLNEEKSVQIEAMIVEEKEPEILEQIEYEPEEEQSLLDFSEDSIEIAEIEEATVAIAIDALEVEVELNAGQQIEMVFDSEPEISGETDMLDIAIQDDEGEMLAEVEVDLSVYRAVVAVEEPTTTVPDRPEATVPPPAPAVVPVVIEIIYDEEIGEIVQEEVVIEAWVASDAEYYQAVAEDRVAEVLGESYVEEIEDVSAWEAPEEFNDTEFDMAEVILSVDVDYWEDEQWDEIDYDDEWFEEQEEEIEEFFGEAVELEVVVEFIEEHEEELEVFFINEEIDEEEFWDAYEEEQELLWEVDNETDIDIAVEEDWLDEDWLEEEDAIIFEDDFGLDVEEEEWEWENEGTTTEDVFLEEGVAEEEIEEELDEWEELTEEWTDEEWGDWEDFVSDEEEEEWYTEEDSVEEELEDIDEEEWNQESDEDGDETWWGDDEPEGEEEDEWLEGSEEEVEEELEEEWEDEWLDDEESESDSSVSDEEEVDEEQVDETEVPSEEEDEEWEDDESITDEQEDENTEDEQEEEVDEESEEEREEESEEILEEVEEELEEDVHVEVEEELPPTTTIAPEPSWDPYEQCRGTSACDSAPGGFDTWEDYDAANNPEYYDDWGDVPVGFVGWVDYTDAVESGEVSAEEAEEELPDFVLEEEIVVVYVEPVHVPYITMTGTAVALQETISTSTSTAQTGTTTTTDVTTDEDGILTQNINDGHWHLDMTTETTTATTVTNTLVDTTTVVERTGIDFVSCTYIDGVQSGCSTQRSWNDPVSTATASDSYTQASTTTAVVSATVMTEEGCAEGGFRGMGDWCMVTSGGRNDHDMVQFTLEETTNVRIDAETNLTYAQFVAGNHEYGDPYIYLNNDNDSDEGDHSADESAITVGTSIETDDDGGRQCDDSGGWNACINPPSNATDPDETPNITYCSSGGACSNGVPVIDNVSDVWDSEIVRTDLAPGDYVVRASVYSTGHDGWYRLTIEEDD